MLNVAIGNGALANGFCCVSVGDGSITRGAFQVRMTEKLSIPSEITVQNLDNTVAALQDLCLTYQAMVEQNHAPAEFAVRAKAAIDVAVDALIAKRLKWLPRRQLQQQILLLLYLPRQLQQVWSLLRMSLPVSLPVQVK